MSKALVELVRANLPSEGAVSVAALQTMLAPGLSADDDPADIPAALEILREQGGAQETADGWALRYKKTTVEPTRHDKGKVKR